MSAQDDNDPILTLSYIEKKGLRVGERYRITFQDCCVQGQIIGTYLRYDSEEDLAIFDTGSIGPSYGSWKVERLADTLTG